MKRLARLSALSLLAVCATSASARPHEGPARLGQRVYVDGITVRPDRVIEDSRCPANGDCIWAGRVVLRATVTGGRWKRTLDLIPGKPVQVADGALTLVSVAPDKMIGRIKPRDYRFRFRFDGGFQSGLREI
ncbi:MAG: hypothetical protein ACO1O3_04765 [Sphingobium sp.]